MDDRAGINNSWVRGLNAENLAAMRGFLFLLLARQQQHWASYVASHTCTVGTLWQQQSILSPVNLSVSWLLKFTGMKTSYTLIAITTVILSAFAAKAQTSWQITGNSNITKNNFIGTTDKTSFKIRTNNNTRLTITPTGFVGIGTTKPNSMLDVDGTVSALASYFGKAYPISVGTSGASYSSVGYGLTFSDTTATYRYLINNDYSSMLSFRAGGFDFNTAPVGTAGNVIPYTNVMRIEQNGNVGIGAFSPAYKFYVTDKPANNSPVVKIENTANNGTCNGLLITAGNNTGGFASVLIDFRRPDGLELGAIFQNSATSLLFAQGSDKRIKNIIGTTQKGLTDLMKIKVYDYTFKSDPQKNVQTGFMAQELYDIFPQAVSKPRDSNEPAEKNPWMVDYGRVTPLIIKAVQEQQQMIEELKKQNENLQKQINELKATHIAKSDEKAAEDRTALK